jgi:hypothetical protein
MSLSAAEVARGWVEFHCDAHGFLVATTPRANVYCGCGKRARTLRHGRLVSARTLKPTAAKARALNHEGEPYVYGCGDCGEDFHGRELQARHRVGPRSAKRCLTAVEMEARGWRQDERGRWRNVGKTKSGLERLRAAA